MQEDDSDDFCDADDEPEAGVLSRMIGNNINKFESNHKSESSSQVLRMEREGLRALIEGIADYRRQ